MVPSVFRNASDACDLARAASCSVHAPEMVVITRDNEPNGAVLFEVMQADDSRVYGREVYAAFTAGDES